MLQSNEATTQRAMLRPQSSRCVTARLPTELLVAIFRLCIPQYMGMRNYIVTSKKHAPLLLCLVCSAWRRLAISTPSLWTELCLDLVYNKAALDLRLLELFIARSQDQPISLQFGDAYTTQGSLLHPMTSLASVASRIHALVFPNRITSLDELEPLSTKLLPCLQVLRLAVEGLEFDSQFWEPNIFGHAPALVSFTYIDNYCDAKVNTVGFLWSQLRHLSVTEHFTDFPGLFQVLQECSTLVSCHLNLEINPDADDELWHSKLPDVTLPRVKRLKIESEDEIAFVLQHIRAPLLEDLDLESIPMWGISGLGPDGQPAFGPLDIVTTFISCHVAHLRQLTLRLVEIPGEDFCRCLTGAEHLEVLRLDRPALRPTNTFEDMFRALTWPHPPVERLVLPNLQHLSVAFSGGTYVGPDLTKLIGSRFYPSKGNDVPQVAGLKSVTIIDLPDEYQYKLKMDEHTTEWGEWWADALEDLEALEADGLQVTYEDSVHYDWGFIDWAWDVVDDRVR